MYDDGLSNLKYDEPVVELTPLFTKISVDIRELPWRDEWVKCGPLNDVFNPEPVGLKVDTNNAIYPLPPGIGLSKKEARHAERTRSAPPAAERSPTAPSGREGEAEWHFSSMLRSWDQKLSTLTSAMIKVIHRESIVLLADLRVHRNVRNFRSQQWGGGGGEWKGDGVEMCNTVYVDVRNAICHIQINIQLSCLRIIVSTEMFWIFVASSGG